METRVTSEASTCSGNDPFVQGVINTLKQAGHIPASHHSYELAGEVICNLQHCCLWLWVRAQCWLKVVKGSAKHH